MQRVQHNKLNKMTPWQMFKILYVMFSSRYRNSTHRDLFFKEGISYRSIKPTQASKNTSQPGITDRILPRKVLVGLDSWTSKVLLCSSNGNKIFSCCYHKPSAYYLLHGQFLFRIISPTQKCLHLKTLILQLMFIMTMTINVSEIHKFVYCIMLSKQIIFHERRQNFHIITGTIIQNI